MLVMCGGLAAAIAVVDSHSLHVFMTTGIGVCIIGINIIPATSVHAKALILATMIMIVTVVLISIILAH